MFFSPTGSDGSNNKGSARGAAAALERWRAQAEGKEMVDETFPVDVDNAFTMLFTNSKFFMDFQKERKSTGETGKSKSNQNKTYVVVSEGLFYSCDNLLRS